MTKELFQIHRADYKPQYSTFTPLFGLFEKFHHQIHIHVINVLPVVEYQEGWKYFEMAKS